MVDTLLVKMLRRVSLIGLFMLFAFPLSASMVSFLVVETGLNEEAASVPYSGLWEGVLMDAFFDAGHIVTNSPIARMEKKPVRDISGTVEEDFNDAVVGGADYFILGFLEYKKQGERAVPMGMALKLYKTDTGKLVYEENFSVGPDNDLDEVYKAAQSAGRIIATHLKDR